MTDDRVIVFIDAQNVYKGARDAFGVRNAEGKIQELSIFGQIHPMKLGQLICHRPPPGHTRSLTEVRVYTGRPDSTKDPKGYGANLAQCSAWEKAGVNVTWRTLRYPRDWPTVKPEEKGIDVALAIDVVRLAIDGQYDVGIICSTDSDLRPALEYVRNKFMRTPKVEVMAWSGAKRLSLANMNIWCHYFSRADFDVISDATDYRRP
jgi:NYN domain